MITLISKDAPVKGPALLKPRHLRALQQAIDDADTWRGAMVGNPDTTALDEHDRFIHTAKAALVLVKQLNRKR